MKVKELIEKLKSYDEELEVVLFASGEWYPTLETQLWEEGDTVVEIGGGWETIVEDEDGS